MPKRTAMITVAWAEQKAIKEVMVFLQGPGVSTSLAVRIYKKYGDAAISVVRAEPYRLAADVGASASRPRTPSRRRPAPNLVADAAKILEVPAEMITPCLDELAAAEGVIQEDVPAGSGTAPQVPPSTCRPFSRPNGLWPPPCSACMPRRATGSRRSPAWTGTRR